MLNFALYFLKANLCCTEPFRKNLNGFCEISLFFGNKRQQCQYVLRKFLLGEEGLSMAMRNMSLGTVHGAAESRALVAGVAFLSILSAGDWA